MGPYGSLWVLIGPYASTESLGVLVGLYASICVLMRL